MPTWEQAPPQSRPFLCAAYRHLYKSGQQLAVHSFIGQLTNGGKTEFFASQERVAEYFGIPYDSMRRTFRILRKKGWLVLVKEGEKRFRWISHDKWVEERADSTGDCPDCYRRNLLPWQIQANEDPLVGKLWAISGGKFRAFPRMIKEARKFASDDEIAELYAKEIAARNSARAANMYAGASVKNCFWN